MPVPVSASVFSSFCKTLHLRARHNMRPVDECSREIERSCDVRIPWRFKC